jgi:hypothetical protein
MKNYILLLKEHSNKFYFHPFFSENKRGSLFHNLKAIFLLYSNSKIVLYLILYNSTKFMS